MTLWDDQFSSAHDLPSGETIRGRYAICSTQRSGSHYLGRLLKQTGQCGDPLEYFNPDNLARWLARMRESDAVDLLDFLESIRSTPNGWFGMKVHFVHLAVMEPYLPLRGFLTRFRLIWIERRDLLRQAISYAKALQTGSFISKVPEQEPAHYDDRLISSCLASIIAQNASWEYLFASSGADVLRVQYEDVRADPVHALDEIGHFLGTDLAPAVGSAGTDIRAQSDERNEEWYQRFRRDTNLRDLSPGSFDIRVASRRTFVERAWHRLSRMVVGKRISPP